jgi:hypothetical protein
MHYSRSHDAVIRVYEGTGNVIETHERKGDFKEPQRISLPALFPDYFTSYSRLLVAGICSFLAAR